MLKEEPLLDVIREEFPKFGRFGNSFRMFCFSKIEFVNSRLFRFSRFLLKMDSLKDCFGMLGVKDFSSLKG